MTKRHTEKDLKNNKDIWNQKRTFLIQQIA